MAVTTTCGAEAVIVGLVPFLSPAGLVLTCRRPTAGTPEEPGSERLFSIAALASYNVPGLVGPVLTRNAAQRKRQVLFKRAAPACLSGLVQTRISGIAAITYLRHSP